MSDAFIEQAKVNFHCILKKSESDPAVFEREMINLGKYHSKDIHVWEGGQCTFHPLKVCSCGNCEKEDLKCQGKPYETRKKLTCPFHSKIYENECETRAARAYEVIHETLGKVNSNLPESYFSVLTRFRAKNMPLEKTCYELCSNLGLLQANLTFMQTIKGDDFNWKTDLMAKCGISLSPSVSRAMKNEGLQHHKTHVYQQKPETRNNRIRLKRKKAVERDERKLVVKRWKISHDYFGKEGDQNLEEEGDGDEEGEGEYFDGEIEDLHAIAIEFFEEEGAGVPEAQEGEGEAEAEAEAEAEREAEAEGGEIDGEGVEVRDEEGDVLWFDVDVEASGVAISQDDITQIAAIALQPTKEGFRKIGSDFSSFVFTPKIIPHNVEVLTGIKSVRKPDSVLRNAPHFPEAISLFLNWARLEMENAGATKGVILGHNIARYDLRILQHQSERMGMNSLHKWHNSWSPNEFFLISFRAKFF